MTAQIYQIRDYQTKKQLEKVEQMAKEILPSIMVVYEMVPYHGMGIDGMYIAPDKDPA